MLNENALWLFLEVWSYQHNLQLDATLFLLMGEKERLLPLITRN